MIRKLPTCFIVTGASGGTPRQIPLWYARLLLNWGRFLVIALLVGIFIGMFCFTADPVPWVFFEWPDYAKIILWQGGVTKGL